MPEKEDSEGEGEGDDSKVGTLGKRCNLTLVEPCLKSPLASRTWTGFGKGPLDRSRSRSMPRL